MKLLGREYDETSERRPNAMRQTLYRGRPVLEFDVRERDGRSNMKAGDAERVRADGWPSPIPYGAEVDIELWMQKQDNCSAPPGGWINWLEIRGLNVKDYSAFKVMDEWSAGAKKSVSRVRVGQINSPGVSVSEPIISDSTFQLHERSEHLLRLKFRIHDTEGFVSLDHYNSNVAIHRGRFGFGPKIAHYFIFGVYRSSRKERTTARMELRRFDVKEVV